MKHQEILKSIMYSLTNNNTKFELGVEIDSCDVRMTNTIAFKMEKLEIILRKDNITFKQDGMEVTIELAKIGKMDICNNDIFIHYNRWTQEEVDAHTEEYKKYDPNYYEHNSTDSFHNILNFNVNEEIKDDVKPVDTDNDR